MTKLTEEQTTEISISFRPEIGYFLHLSEDTIKRIENKEIVIKKMFMTYIDNAEVKND